jgi:enoyl-CoA hydratase/carnithine racemase
MRFKVRGTVNRCSVDPSIRAVVLTGSGEN